MTKSQTILSHIHQQGDITHLEATELYGINREVFLEEITDLVWRRMLKHEKHTITLKGEKQTIYRYTFTDEGRIAWERHPASNFKPQPTSHE